MKYTLEAKLWITAVAVIHEGVLWALPPPNRHHNVLHKIHADLELGENKPAFGEEGFIIDEKFVSRELAMLAAKFTGQLNRREGPNYYQGDELFSEDLW